MDFLNEFKEKLNEKGELYLDIKAHPSAKKSQIVGETADGALKIDLVAPAEKGKANQELIRLLAKEFAIPKINVKLLAGKGGRQKLIKLSL